MKLEIINEHVILTDRHGCRALLDTGSPSTWGDREFHLDGQRLPVRQGRHAMPELSAMIGAPVHHLVGSDTLRSHVMRLDWERGSLEFVSRPLSHQGGRELAVTLIHGIPAIEARFGEEQHEMRAVLDTGASVNFIDGLGEGPQDEFGTHQDFRPDTLERFSARFAYRKWTLEAVSHVVPTAELPRDMAAALGMLQCRGIIGLPFLRRQPLVLDLGTGRVRLEV